MSKDRKSVSLIFRAYMERNCHEGGAQFIFIEGMNEAWPLFFDTYL